MRTNDDIEAYLIELGKHFEQIDEGMWVVRDDDDLSSIVIYHAPPVIIFRVKLMELPKNRREELFEKLLILNATDMVHGAYGLEDNNIVCVDSLQSENLDFNEFQASVEALALAINSHYPILKEFREDPKSSQNDEEVAESKENE